MVIGDEELAAELATMTDWHTDRIAEVAAQIAVANRSGAVLVAVNPLSRLVVDPERFTDDYEPMAAVGMGAVYTRRADGTVLRAPDAERDASLLARYFEPYATAVADLVDQVLEESGRCLLVDVHSYPSVALPYELDPAAARPEVCLGTDPFHTPPALLALARSSLTGATVGPEGGPNVEGARRPWTVAENTPFAGTYVPLRHLERDPRVWSIMFEARRDTYLDEPSTWRDGDARQLATALGRFVRSALERQDTLTPGRESCPACGSDAVVPIAYGMPGADLGEAARRGEVALGGCIIGPGQPSLACRSCDARFSSLGGTPTWPWGGPRLIPPPGTGLPKQQ
jgi:N-formylglutamate amidohydrolase